MILELGGKTFNLGGSPKLKLLVELEKSGIKMINRRPDEDFTVEQNMTLIHQALLSVDPEVTEEWVQDVVTVDNLKEVGEAIGSFFKPKEQSV